MTTNEVSHYIDGGGARLSIVDNVVTWTHLDHQGSAVAATNASGSKLWEERYLPFGEKLVDPSANQDRPGYTGHVQDSWSGLTYMQARYYDPVLGRFMQTDPIGYQDQLNLYAYVHNDPVNMVDPDGRLAWFAIPAVCAGGGCKVAIAAAGAVACNLFCDDVGEAINGTPDDTIIGDSLLGDALETIVNSDNQGDVGLPETLVGDDQRKGNKGRVNSGPLSEEAGGTGDADRDFEALTGGNSQPAPEDMGLPEGSRVGDNGVQIRPGKEGEGPRIDIPSKGDKPRETLHYPEKKN